MPAVNLCSRLVISERTRMSVLPYRSEFAQQKLVIRTPKDGRGANQKQVLCTKLVFYRHTRMYVGKKCTRRYTSGQAIFKRLTERLFYYVATLLKTPLRIRR